MNDYSNYTKCGEILKSPNINEKDQYEFVLKCVCEEGHYVLLESFAFPCPSLGDEKLTEVFSIHGENSCETISIQRCAVVGIEQDSINLESGIADEKDPLNVIKDNNTSTDNEMVNVKEEYIVQHTDEYTNLVNEFAEESLEVDEQLSDYSDEANWENIDSDDALNEYEECQSDKFVQNFMKSKPKVTFLIEAYKNQPKLWNIKCPQFKLKQQHTTYLGKIKKELKDKINLQISCNQVAAVIQYLWLKYKEYMKPSEDRKKVRKTHNKSVWFFEHLEFLKPFAENNSTPEINPLQSDLESEKIIQVIAIYKRFPHLWNTNLVENSCRNKRHEALGRMLEAINSEMNLSINENCLKKYLHFIHNQFTKEKRRIIRNSDPKTGGSYEYYKHMMFLYDHVGPFKCSECDIELRNPLYFKVHKSQHDGSVPLTCSLCNKEFKILRTYTLHARRHMDDLEEVCKECGKKFINTCELNIHMRFHTGAKPYCCEICGVSFRHIQTFTSHKRRHEKQYLHTCSICSKGFYSKAKMDDHIRSHKQIREFNCKTCGKAFITKKTLQQHQVTHEDIRRHSCTLCGKSFKLKVGVTQHMKTHGSQTYERPDDQYKTL